MAAQSASKPQSIEIKLGGQKILLKAGESDPALTRQIVDLVSGKIKTAEKRGKGLAPHQVALLALLDLAEEYISAKQRTSAFKREMNERSDSLMRLLETELGA
jgi:cell division protein ZapA (FtsZ GTPase activity inhibitor)